MHSIKQLLRLGSVVSLALATAATQTVSATSTRILRGGSSQDHIPIVDLYELSTGFFQVEDADDASSTTGSVDVNDVHELHRLDSSLSTDSVDGSHSYGRVLLGDSLDGSLEEETTVQDSDLTATTSSCDRDTPASHLQGTSSASSSLAQAQEEEGETESEVIVADSDLLDAQTIETIVLEDNKPFEVATP